MGEQTIFGYILMTIGFGTAVVLYNSIYQTYKENSCFTSKKDWNGGICPNCGKIYQYDNTGSDHNVFTCDCHPSGHIQIFLFRKRFTNEVVRYYQLKERLDKYTSNITVNRVEPITADMIYIHHQYKKELRDHLDRNYNKKWSKYIYENIL